MYIVQWESSRLAVSVGVGYAAISSDITLMVWAGERSMWQQRICRWVTNATAPVDRKWIWWPPGSGRQCSRCRLLRQVCVWKQAIVSCSYKLRSPLPSQLQGFIQPTRRGGELPFLEIPPREGPSTPLRIPVLTMTTSWHVLCVLTYCYNTKQRAFILGLLKN